MENKQTASEFSFRKKERFQVPLGLSFLSFLLALYGPLFFERLRHKKIVALLLPLLMVASPARADLKDEVLARPSRETSRGLKPNDTKTFAKAAR